MSPPDSSTWRAYHQAMPIDRRIHDLARISMGGAWFRQPDRHMFRNVQFNVGALLIYTQRLL